MKFPRFTITLSLTFILLLTFSSGKVFSMDLLPSKEKIDSNERANSAEHENQARLRESGSEDESDDQGAAVERGVLGYGTSSFEEPRAVQEEEEARENSGREVQIGKDEDSSENLNTVSTGAPDASSATAAVVYLEGRKIAAVTSEIQKKKPALNHAPSIEFSNSYNRADEINKKKDAYQAELESAKANPAPSESTERIESLTRLISILEKAAKYQNAMVLHLQKEPSPATKAFLSSREAFGNVVAIENSIKINSRPNKIERIVEEVEEDYKALTDYQSRLAEKQAALQSENGAPAPNQDRINQLEVQVDHLNNAITHRRRLLELRENSATLLPFPFEEINAKTKADLARNKWDCVSEKALSQAADLYQQAVTAEGAGQLRKARHLKNAGNSLFKLAEEAQKPEPQERVIDLYIQAKDLYQQAVTAEGAGQPQKAHYLKNAGYIFFKLAEEAQKPQPQELVMAWYTQSAELHQQAVTAEDAGQPQKANYLANAGISLFKLAEETQKSQPQGRVIAWYTQATNLYQQAVAAEDAGQPQKAIYLNNTGNSLFRAAQEAQKPHPQERAITLCAQSAELHQQAVAAEDAAQHQKAIYLTNAGISLFRAAKEAQTTQPREQFINARLREAECLKQMASENSCCTIS